MNRILMDESIKAEVLGFSLVVCKHKANLYASVNLNLTLQLTFNIQTHLKCTFSSEGINKKHC